MLVPKALQNRSNWDTIAPTVVVTPSQPEWQEAYENWIAGKNPTNSPEWKKGVFMTFEESPTLED